MGNAGLVRANSRAIYKTKCRLEVFSNLLEIDLPSPRFIWRGERDAERIVVTERVRKAALKKNIGLKNLIAEEIRIAILEVSSNDGVVARPGGVAIGNDDTNS